MRSIGGTRGIGCVLPQNAVGGDNFIRRLGDRLLIDFHEGAGTTVRDLSGWGNDLSLTGNKNWRRGSFYLDGSSYFSILGALQAGLNMGLSDFMVEAKVKLTVPIASQSASTPYIVGKRAVNAVGYWLYLIKSSSYLQLSIKDTALNIRVVNCSSSALDDLRWHSIHAVIDRSSSTGLKLYIDGQEVTYRNQQDPSSLGTLDNGVAFNVGAHSDTTNKIEASIDELRVFNFGIGGLHIGPIVILQQYLYHKWNIN